MRTLRALLVLILTASLIPGWAAASVQVCPQASAAAEAISGGKCEGCDTGSAKGCVAVSCLAPCALHLAVSLPGAAQKLYGLRDLPALSRAATPPLPRSIPPTLPPPR